MRSKFDLAGVPTQSPLDHDSTFHVTETPALTTRPSVTYSDWLCLLCLGNSKLNVSCYTKRITLRFNPYNGQVPVSRAS